MGQIQDREGRVYRKLRVSVTDRCQFRCFYCMPDGPAVDWLPRERVLSFEQIALAVRWLAGRGVGEIRITGGEPLLRRGVPDLVAMLRATPGVRRVALTTNGLCLAERLDELVAAGLDAVTVSLDTLHVERFEQFVGVPGAMEGVLRGLDRLAASNAVLDRKLNAVAVRGGNDDEIPRLLAFAVERGFEARFIEFMPFGSRWSDQSVLGEEEIVRRIEDVYGGVEPLVVSPGSTSRRWRVPGLGAAATFGVIPTMSGALCRECDRLRLSASGRVHRCLFDANGLDVSGELVAGDEGQFIRGIEMYLAGKGPGFLAEHRVNLEPRGHMNLVGG